MHLILERESIWCDPRHLSLYIIIGEEKGIGFTGCDVAHCRLADSQESMWNM